MPSSTPFLPPHSVTGVRCQGGGGVNKNEAANNELVFIMKSAARGGLARLAPCERRGGGWRSVRACARPLPPPPDGTAASGGGERRCRLRGFLGRSSLTRGVAPLRIGESSTSLCLLCSLVFPLAAVSLLLCLVPTNHLTEIRVRHCSC